MKAPTLAELQDAFTAYLHHGTGAIGLSIQVAVKNIDPMLRLDVYRHAYYIRLEEALAHDFPMLRAALGDHAFGRLMAEYLHAHPSTSPTVRDLGRALPRWLHNQGMENADLASIEWALLASFDAADVPLLDPEALAQIPPEHWAELRVHLHPSVTLLELNSNAAHFWQAIRAGTATPPLTEGAQNWLAIARGGSGPALTQLTKAEHAVLSRLAHGECFAIICEEMSDSMALNAVPHFVAETVARAVASGWVATMASI
jgi:hypothetical protein